MRGCRRQGRQQDDARITLSLLSVHKQIDMSQRVYTFGYRVPRFRTDFHLLLQAEGTQPHLLDGHCMDISEDGLSAEFHTSLELGAHVNLILTLPGSSTSLRVTARVSNRTGDFYGFAFTFLCQSDRERVRRYVQSLQRSRSTHP